LTDDKIDQILKMPKRITNPKAREVMDANHLKRDYIVESLDGDETFVLFTRQNRTVQEDFSCGFRWLTPGSEGLTLVRYNGPSHLHVNRREGNRLEFVPHIHRVTERYIQNNLKPEGFAEATTKYRTLSGALHELVTDLRITGIETTADHPELFE
jgi:Family of unknown function (DUF6978)